MSLTLREVWGIMHGMIFGGIFILAFSGGLVLLYDMQRGWLTDRGLQHQTLLLRFSTLSMAIIAWLTVITGTYIVYPWYRATPPEGADLTFFPRSYLKADPNLSGWHSFGMEWKEHVTWFVPILVTAIAYIVWRYGDRLVDNSQLRKLTTIIFVVSFAIAAIAGGLFGALITKIAPVI